MKTLLLAAIYIASLGVSFSSQAQVSSQVKACMEQECQHWFSEYKRKSREGYADAMEVLGTFYHVGYGTKIDKKLALKWYRRASKYSSVSGAYKAGLFYLTEPEFIDLDKGISYLKIAARLGHAESSYLVGMIFSQNELVEQDYDEADKWLSKAFVKNHNQVKLYTGYLESEKLLTQENFPELYQLAQEYNEKTQMVQAQNVSTEQSTSDQSQSNIQVASHTSQTQTQAQGIDAPTGEMEVIEVTPLTLVELFEADFKYFSTFMAEKRDSQARKGLYLRPCAQTISCSEMDKDDMKRLAVYNGAGALVGN